MRRITMAPPARTFTTTATGRSVNGATPMVGGLLAKGQYIGGRRIVTMPAPVMVNGGRAVKVRFDDGTSNTYGVTELVAVTGRRELAAGPVKQGWAVSAPRKAIVDPAQGKWRGEGSGNSRRVDMIAGMAAYDG